MKQYQAHLVKKLWSKEQVDILLYVLNRLNSRKKFQKIAREMKSEIHNSSNAPGCFEFDKLKNEYYFLWDNHNKIQMTELQLQRLPNGQISCVMDGSHAEIAIMLVQAMVANIDIATIVNHVIPTFNDVKGIDKKNLCKVIMERKGSK